jgi:hypothetical protein
MLSRRETILLIVLFLASLPAVTARLYSSDEVQYFSYLRSLWFDRDVSFENEYRYFYDHRIAQTPGFYETFLVRTEAATGRRINYGTLGCASLWAPFYGVADVSVRAMRAAGRNIPADGFSWPYVSAVASGSAFYGWCAILLAILGARRVVGARAISSGLLVWAGTPLLFYSYVAPPFSHACSAFAVALFVTVWLRVRETWTVAGTAALGLSAALMAMVREQDVFFVSGPMLDFLWTFARSSGGRSLRPRITAALTGCAAFAAGYLPQLLAYLALNGRPGPSPLVGRKMFWYAPHALQVLADPRHGFLFWTPLAALALAGLIVMTAAGRDARGAAEAASMPSPRDAIRIVSASDRRRVGACLLLMVALQVYISGAVESWTVAGAFGQRRFVAVTIVLVIGLAALRDWIRGRIAGRALTAAIALCVWWNLALMAEFGTSMMDRQRLDLGRNAYDAFITLPRTAPDLVRRYFTARSSFYRPPESR